MGERHRKWGKVLPHLEVTGSTYFITCSLRDDLSPFRPKERKLLLDACAFLHTRKWKLHAVVVMPTHVHLLVTMLKKPDGDTVSLAEAIHSLKSFTAHEINKLRKRKGPLWFRGYYDTLVRDGKGASEFYNYIWQNPVKEGLAESAEEYPFFWVDESFFS